MPVASERQPQAERHYARLLGGIACATVDKLRLTKRTAGKIGIDAVEVWMVGQILSLGAEAQIDELRYLEGFVHAEIQVDKSRSMENVPP